MTPAGLLKFFPVERCPLEIPVEPLHQPALRIRAMLKGEVAGPLVPSAQADAAQSRTITQAGILGSDGTLYGTTSLGGGNIGVNSGALFQITPKGVLTTLHDFNYVADGYGGEGVIQSTNGILFGIEDQQPQTGGGSVFSFDEGLSPFVETLPSAGNAERQ
jgi:uncharacterized repeat protein (TIGR03803 family)